METRTSFLRPYVACFSVLLLLTATVSAQFKASIQGTVTDSSGAVVSNATVTVTNQETGKSQQVKTSDEGFYRVGGLAPGTYTVTVESSGFKRTIVENMRVQAEEAQGVDLTLEPGQVSESVTVTGDEEAQLKTENANVDRSISTREILRIPQVGRDPYDLLRLTPGVFGDGSRSGSGNSVGLPNTTGPGGSSVGTSIFQVENQVPISANGQRVSANNYQIDGVSVNSLTWGGAAVVTPNQESIKEMRVLSSVYSAEYGRNTGAQVQVVSQNGTNDFHGSAFIKYNDPDLNAFNKFGGITNDPLVSSPPVRVDQQLRQFGGSLGGRIIRDKLFFFFSYEGLRNNSTNFANRFVETPEFRQLIINQRPGGVSAGILAAAGIEPRINEALGSTCAEFAAQNRPCAEVAGGLDIGSPTGILGQYVASFGDNALPGGGGLDGIPDIRFVQLALPNRFRGDQYNPRIDYLVGSNQFSGSLFYTRPDTLGSDLGGQSRPMGDIRSTRLNGAITGIWIRTISATMLNELRANATRFAFDEVETASDVDWGIPRVEVEGLPLFPGGERIRFGANRGEGTPGVFAQNTFEIRDTLSKVWGTHGLKFGAEVRREQDNNNLAGGARPVYSFVGLWNLANDTPIFEGINVDPATGLPADGQRYFRTSDYGLFVQDDWKFRPNLTLNLGLRWEYFTPLREKRDRISNIVFPEGRLIDSRVVVTDELFEPDRNNFAPRVGFAWSPTRFEQSLVVRGGFGVGYNRIQHALFGNTRGNPPFFARNFICCGTAGNPVDSFGTPFAEGRILYNRGASDSPFSYPINPALAGGIDPVTGGVLNNTVEIYGTEPNLRTAYSYNWSLETEYQFPRNFIGSLGYQGSATHKLIRIADLTLLQPRNERFDPVFFLIPDVNANYNALIARLSRSFTQGIGFDAVYRWSKSIDTLSFEGPGGVTNQTFPADQRTERGPSDYDVRHHFVLSGNWDLPIFRGRTDWIGHLFGGWQINGIWTKHSGFPWTPKLFSNLRQPGGKFFGPIRPVGYFGGAGDDSSDRAFLTGSNFPGGGPMFFDTTVAGDPPTIELNPPGIGRNSFRGPKYSQFDFSFVKSTGLPIIPGVREGARLELRANLFNAFNQLNLAPISFFDAGVDINSPNFGRSLAGLSGRVIELQARFSF
jgi:hypothetical protein